MSGIFLLQVLSTTEAGDLIIWDGGLIKCVVNQPEGKPCHNGPIEVSVLCVELVGAIIRVLFHSGDKLCARETRLTCGVCLVMQSRQVVHMNHEEGYIRTAGADGCVRYWDFEKMNDIEPEEDSHTVQLAPTKVVTIGDGNHHIKTLIDDAENGRWIMLDEKGAIIVTTPEGKDLRKVSEFHSGGIVQLATCPSAHFAVTAGADGSIRLYDYLTKPSLLYTRSFSSPVSAMLMLPPHVDPSQRVTLVGFKDGLVRALMRDVGEWKLAAAFKPHKESVSAISVSPDGKLLATAGKDGSVFFFSILSPAEFEPIAFIVVQVCSWCLALRCLAIPALPAGGGRILRRSRAFPGCREHCLLLGRLRQAPRRLRERRGDGSHGARPGRS